MVPSVSALANVEGVHLTPQTQTLFEVIRLPWRSHRSYVAAVASPFILGTRGDARTSPNAGVLRSYDTPTPLGSP